MLDSRLWRQTHTRARGAVVTILLAAALGGAACGSHRVAAPPPSVGARLPAPVCFPTDQLAEPDRAIADEILLTLGDGEGLYTLAGGLKPLSSGMALSVRVAPDVDQEVLAQIDQRRRAASALHCGNITVFMHTFAAAQQTDDGRTLRVTEVVVAHRASVAAAVRRHETFFSRLGISPSADPFEVAAAVEHAGREDRWRGYGYLFGYPDHAVDFFVQAGSDGDATGKLVPRDFRRIDTFTRHPGAAGGKPEQSSFVYAVPAGAPESDAERALQEAAAPMYARYVAERQAAIRADRSGAVALWRRWLAPTR